MENDRMKTKSIYQDKSLNTTIFLFVIAALMIGLSLNLTQHYFDIKFPTGLEGKSLCNINGFFNCDKTTLSPFSNILSIPISLFGALMGLIVLIGIAVKNEDYERTTYFALIVNFIGCVVLFLYSLTLHNRSINC